LADLFENMMMHGLTNPKFIIFIIRFKVQLETTLTARKTQG